MTDALIVVVDGDVAGTISRLPQGRLRFDYDPSYRERAGSTPLSLSMPVQVPSHADHLIRPWLLGLLPENEAVISRWARHFHVSASSPFALLGTPIGEDCAGAVQFEHGGGVLRRSGDVQWLTSGAVAARLRDLREDSAAWLGKDFTGQFSLAGAQAKTALLFRYGRWGVPSGSTPTTHILKPAIAGFDDHDLNQNLCLDAARRAGLLAVRTHVTRFGRESAVVIDRYDRMTVGDEIRRVHQEDLCQALAIPPFKRTHVTRFGRESAVVIDRYDRMTVGDEIRRVHQEDLCQALAIPPFKKYQNEGGPRPADVAALFRRSMPPRIAEASVVQFADALIFNWLIAGTDAHAKNYSLLLAGNEVRMAPLYDVASALPYGVHERRLRLAMKVGGDDRVVPQRNTWPEAARELEIDADRLADRVRELALALPQAFSEAANAPEVRALGRPLPFRLVELVADRAARCAHSGESDHPDRSFRSADGVRVGAAATRSA